MRKHDPERCPRCGYDEPIGAVRQGRALVHDIEMGIVEVAFHCPACDIDYGFSAQTRWLGTPVDGQLKPVNLEAQP